MNEKEKKIQSLKRRIESMSSDITTLVAEYLDLYEDTDVMHRDVVESEIESLRNGDEENNMEAGRLELMLRDNPGVTYFDYYHEIPITYEWLAKRLDVKLAGGDSPMAQLSTELGSTYVRAIEALTDVGLGQKLTDALIACACRNALDDYEEETADLGFDAFCNVVTDLWLDCEDNTCVCKIADWLVQWHIHGPEDDWPTSFFALAAWAEDEGL